MKVCITTEEKITDVVEQYSGMILRIAWQTLGSRADAEDVMQDVFVRLMAHAEFESEEHLKAWLIRVTINRCKDIAKSFWRRKTVPLKPELPAQLGARQSAVMDEILKLNGKDRNILYLYYFEGYKIPEIAKLTNENANTVNSRLTRARGKLKVRLEEGGVEIV